MTKNSRTRVKAKKDLLENIGFIKLRMERSIKLVTIEKLEAEYIKILAVALIQISKMERELTIATVDKIWRDKL